jgi:hypothetical protein
MFDILLTFMLGMAIMCKIHLTHHHCCWFVWSIFPLWAGPLCFVFLLCVSILFPPKFFLVLFVASQYHGWVFPSLLDLQQKLSIHVSVYTDLYPFLGVVKVSGEVIHLRFSVTRQISKLDRISRDECVVQVLYNPRKIYNVITYMCRS